MRAAIGPWGLVTGAALCGFALLLVLLGFVTHRTPRAKGLAETKRGFGLASAADRVEALGDRLLQRRGIDALNRSLDAAGVDARPAEVLVAVVAVDLVALLAGWAILSPLIGLVVAVTIPLMARIVLDQMAKRRRTRFSYQLAETLQLLAGSLRAGHGLAQAVDTVAREAESPTAEEFRRLTIETRLGRDFVDSLSSLADRVGNDDFRWVVQAVEIQRDVGGDLAEIFDTVGDTVRDRIRIRRQVSALSAEGRMSAWVLMVLPFGLGGFLWTTNPVYLRPLFDSTKGNALLGVAALLLVVGGLWLRRIVKPIF